MGGMKPRFSLAAIMLYITAVAVLFGISKFTPVWGSAGWQPPVASQVAWRLAFVGTLAVISAAIMLRKKRR